MGLLDTLIIFTDFASSNDPKIMLTIANDCNRQCECHSTNLFIKNSFLKLAHSSRINNFPL